MRSETRKVIFTIFVIIMLLFLFWNMHRAGIFQKEHDDIIARADYLIERSESHLARWNHGVGR